MSESRCAHTPPAPYVIGGLCLSSAALTEHLGANIRATWPPACETGCDTFCPKCERIYGAWLALEVAHFASDHVRDMSQRIADLADLRGESQEVLDATKVLDTYAVTLADYLGGVLVMGNQLDGLLTATRDALGDLGLNIKNGEVRP